MIYLTKLPFLCGHDGNHIIFCGFCCHSATNLSEMLCLWALLGGGRVAAKYQNLAIDAYFNEISRMVNAPGSSLSRKVKVAGLVSNGSKVSVKSL